MGEDGRKDIGTQHIDSPGMADGYVPPSASIDPKTATVDDMTGILGPNWTGGLNSVEWVRRQRGED